MDKSAFSLLTCSCWDHFKPSTSAPDVLDVFMHLSYDVTVSRDFHRNCPLDTHCVWLLNQMLADQFGTWRPQEPSSVCCMLVVPHQDSGIHILHRCYIFLHCITPEFEFLPLLSKVKITMLFGLTRSPFDSIFDCRTVDPVLCIKTRWFFSTSCSTGQRHGYWIKLLPARINGFYRQALRIIENIRWF